jgi:hypothetical protein
MNKKTRFTSGCSRVNPGLTIDFFPMQIFTKSNPGNATVHSLTVAITESGIILPQTQKANEVKLWKGQKLALVYLWLVGIFKWLLAGRHHNHYPFGPFRKDSRFKWRCLDWRFVPELYVPGRSGGDVPLDIANNLETQFLLLQCYNFSGKEKRDTQINSFAFKFVHATAYQQAS